MALGFIDVDLVAMGNYESVKRAIDAGTGNNIVSNTELMRQVNEFEGNNVWAVGRFDALANSGNLPSALQQQITTIRWFSAAGHVNGGVEGIFKAEARDEEAAQNLRDMLNGVLAMARMQASTRPEFKTVVDSLQLTGDGKNIALSFSLPAELLDALETMAKQHGEMH
jgi:signal transduction histidine kinase